MSAQARHTRSWVFHDQPPALVAAARRARPLLHRRDDHQIGRAALTLGQPLPPALGQLGRDPVRAIRPLDPLIARLREPQRASIPGARHIRGLARRRAARRGPVAKDLHRGRDLPQVRGHDCLQIRDPPLAPLIHPARLEPPQTDQHVDRGHEPPLRECGLSRPHHPPIELAARTTRHEPARYTPRGRRKTRFRSCRSSLEQTADGDLRWCERCSRMSARC
jgi:hypothetical protein